MEDPIKKLDIQDLLYYVKEECKKCMQCGKCVGICPAAEVSSFNSRKIIYMIKMGNMDAVLGSNEMWSCVLCASCYAVCPNGINFSSVLMLLRVISFYYGCGWEMDRMALPFAEYYLNTGVTVPDAEDPGIVEMLKAKTGTGGTMEEFRVRMGLEPKRKVSEKAMKEIRCLAESSGMISKMELIKGNETAKRLIDDVRWISMCNEVFQIIGKLPGGRSYEK